MRQGVQEKRAIDASSLVLLLVAIFFVLQVIIFLPLARDIRFDDPKWGDFRVFFDAAMRLSRGARLYFVDDMGYPNPPFLAWMLQPFTLLAYPVARWIWTVLSYLLTAGACFLLLGNGPATPARRAWLWATLLSMPAFVGNILTGQNVSLVLLAIALYYVLVKSGKPLWAGVALGLVLVKPQFATGPLVVLLAARRWRELIGFAVISVALGVFSFFLVGMNGVLDYLAVARYRLTWVERGGFFRLDMHTPNALIHSLVADPYADVLVVLFGTAVVAAVIWYYRQPERRNDLVMVCAFFAVAGLLISPYAHAYDAILLATCWLLLAPRADRMGKVLLIASYLAPTFHVLMAAIGGPLYESVVINTALLAYLCWSGRHKPAEGNSTEFANAPAY